MGTRIISIRSLLTTLAMMVSVVVIATACGTDQVTEVVKEVEVPGETVVVVRGGSEDGRSARRDRGGGEEVVKTVEVPGETVVVVEEVVKTVEVPGETVVVVEEVVKTVEVEKPVEVIKEVVKEVEVVREVVVEASRPMTRPVPGAGLTVVVKDVGPPGWHTPTTPAPYNSLDVTLGVQENLLDVAMDGRYLPMVAREWVVNEEGITWTINPGVPWHDPAYGTIDAEDVFWSFENGSREGTVAHFTGWYAADFQNPQIIDRYTVKWDWGEAGPTLRYGLTTRNFTSGTSYREQGLL